MKQKHLANVLIKILGLSLLPQCLLHLVSGSLEIWNYWSIESAGRLGFGTFSTILMWTNIFSGLLLAIIGFGFILGSQKLTERLFKIDRAESEPPSAPRPGITA